MTPLNEKKARELRSNNWPDTKKPEQPKIKKSDIFWNSIAVLALIVLALCNFMVFLFIFFFIGTIASFIAVIFALVDADVKRTWSDDPKNEKVSFDMKPFYILYLNPAFWSLIGILYAICYAGEGINKFNKYLNK